MAAAKRLSPEQIVARLRDAEKMQAQGATIPQVCKKLGVWFPPNRGGLPYAASRSGATVFS